MQECTRIWRRVGPLQLDEEEIDEAVALIEAMARDDLTGPEFADRYTAALHR